MSTNRILLAFLFLFGIIQVTGAVKCFDCHYFKLNSEPTGDEMCRDSFGGDSKFEVECRDTTEFCYKFIGIGYSGDNKYEDAVQRGCAPDKCEKEGVEEMDGEDGKGSLHCCKGDNCNSATSAIPGLTVLLASILLFWLV